MANNGAHQPICIEDLAGVVSSGLCLHAFCPDCLHAERVSASDLLKSHGNMRIDELRRRLVCTACRRQQPDLHISWTGYEFAYPGAPRG